VCKLIYGAIALSVEEYITTHLENDFAGVTARRYEEVVKGHGRIDTLIYYHLPAPSSLSQKDKWSGLRTIGVAIRISEQNGNLLSVFAVPIFREFSAVCKWRVRSRHGCRNGRRVGQRGNCPGARKEFIQETYVDRL
jgi:hypothetical protein